MKDILGFVIIVATMLVVMVTQSNKQEYEVIFEEFKKDYGRKYQNKETQFYRYMVFIENLQAIQKSNMNPEHSFKLGITQFSDWTSKQYQQIMLMKISQSQLKNQNIPYYQSQNQDVPNAIDWTTKGSVTPIKYQGQCASGWAFSSIGAIEANYKLKYKLLQSFSQQQLLDCCGYRGYQCQGCNGAWPQQAFNYIKDYYIKKTSQYPYTGVVSTCKDNTGWVKISSYYMANSGNLTDIKNMLNFQPVSVFVDAQNWAQYRSGVFNQCGTQINHGALLVGIDNSGVWKVKNSYGTNWGQKGYIRLSPGNTCGILQHAIVTNP